MLSINPFDLRSKLLKQPLCLIIEKKPVFHDQQTAVIEIAKNARCSAFVFHHTPA